MIPHTEIAGFSKVQRNVGFTVLFSPSLFPFPINCILQTVHCALADLNVLTLNTSGQEKINYGGKNHSYLSIFSQHRISVLYPLFTKPANCLFTYLHVCLFPAITLLMFHWFWKILMTWNPLGCTMGSITRSRHVSEAGYLSDMHINMRVYLYNDQE